jgi:hypothetical protein
MLMEGTQRDAILTGKSNIHHLDGYQNAGWCGVGGVVWVGSAG